MAANGANSIRVRLHFDYPPPAVTNSRMCLMLVDLNKCRVVADLASLIREKFCFSRKNIFSLFVADCYLPHAESVNVVRDNDAIRVKVESLPQESGFDCSFHSEASGKRRRDAEEEPTENVVDVKCKKKKRKKNNEEHQQCELTLASNGGGEMDKLKITKKEKKAQHDAQRTTKSTKSTKPSTSVAKPVKIPANALAPTKVSSTKRQTVSSTDGSDTSSEEDDVVKKTALQKPSPKTIPCKPASLKKVKATATKPCPTPSPSSSKKETSNKASSEAPRETPLKKKSLTQGPTKSGTSLKITNGVEPSLPSNQSKNSVHKHIPVGSDQHVKKVGEKERVRSSSSSSSSDEEIKLIIKRPIQGADKWAVPVTRDAVWNQQGRGMAGTGGRERQRTLCMGRPNGADQGFNFNYEEGHPQQKQSFQSGSMNQYSVILKNRTESLPKRDYSALPLLAAPPQIGQKIAFKLLELSENYTPEVSAYKEGKIVNFDPITKQTELELLGVAQAHQPMEPGKFDLVYQHADGSETVEYAVSRGSMVTERWDSLLEPRLII